MNRSRGFPHNRAIDMPKSEESARMAIFDPPGYNSFFIEPQAVRSATAFEATA
jgi:hypothetical protein